MWLVTGANGQLGKVLSGQLSDEGLNFVALDFKELDITNLNQVNRTITRIKPYVIVNTAAWTDVDGAETNREAVFAVNEKGVENLVLAARKNSSIFIQISTDYVFSGKYKKPLSEDSALDPQGTYGRSKAAGEIVVNRIHPELSYILRTAWLYSEFGDNFAKKMCSLALKTNKEVRVVDDQVGQPTSARDLASRIISLTKSGAEFGTYHGTNSGQASWFEFAQEIFRLSGADVQRVLPVPSSQYPSTATRPAYSVLAHQAWNQTRLAPMRNWKLALEHAMPKIINSIYMER